MRLRDYQDIAVENTIAASRRGVRSALFVCPTGGGKSPVFAILAGRAAAKGARTLILTDRKVLTDQAADYVREWAPGLTVGFEQGARYTVGPLPDVVCATIQSIRRPSRLRRFRRDAFGLIVIDEADLGIAPSYSSVLERFPGAFRFGCTATPDRHDGRSLGEIFEEVAHTVDMRDLIERGYLSPLRRSLIRIESVSLESLPTHDGDFSDAALTRILTQERPLHEVARPTLELAGDRPTLVFAATVEHAEALAGIFNRYRPGAARVIHGGMKDAERAAILGAYRRREFQFLCNCALLLRGIDLPFVSCVAMARPTLSRALYAQSIGRGTRRAKGKADLLVLDFTDNSDTHSLVSLVDVLAPGAPEDVKERAREIMDEEQGADPLALDRAEAELEADPALRERVRAKVAYRMRAAALDWNAIERRLSELDLPRLLGTPRGPVRHSKKIVKEGWV